MGLCRGTSWGKGTRRGRGHGGEGERMGLRAWKPTGLAVQSFSSATAPEGRRAGPQAPAPTRPRRRRAGCW